MTASVERNPQAQAATTSNKFPTYKVIVTGIDMTKASSPNSDPRGIANTVDTFSKLRQIPVSMIIGSGPYPQVGETWIVNQMLGNWTFLARQVPVTPEVTDQFSLAAGLTQLGLVNGPPGGIIDQIQVLDAPPENPKLGQQYYDSNLEGQFIWNGVWWMPGAAVTPVGGVVFSQQWPTTQTNFASGSTGTLGVTVPLVNGWQYTVTLTCMQATQITAASATAVQVYCRDSYNFIPAATGIKAFIYNSLPLNGYASGSQTIPLIPTATVNDVFTVTVSTGASSLQIPANCLAFIILRTG